jgi:hypothetical protein
LGAAAGRGSAKHAVLFCFCTYQIRPYHVTVSKPAVLIRDMTYIQVETASGLICLPGIPANGTCASCTVPLSSHDTGHHDHLQAKACAVNRSPPPDCISAPID